jgi:3-hydroxyisobutyrate dehydrogenase/2-hydroxy-3-oxopropionate reductase
MGRPMAQRLLRAGFQVAVWNRTAFRAEQLGREGARVAESPADAARGAAAVVTMVTDANALEAVADGPEGLIAGVGPGTVLVEMSTVGPSAVLRLADRLPMGVALVDAPVLGSIDQAASGELDILVGAEASTLQQCVPLLDVLGRWAQVGGPGAGAAAKLVANSTLFGVLVVLGEALALARALGLDNEAVYQVLDRTPLAAQALRRRPAVDHGEYPPRFALEHARKDAQLIAQAAAERGLEMRAALAALAWLADADDAGLGGRDYTAVLARILGPYPR